MHVFFHELARMLTIVMLCVAGFGFFVLVIAVVIQCTGSIVFGQRFRDWWDNKFWF